MTKKSPHSLPGYSWFVVAQEIPEETDALSDHDKMQLDNDCEQLNNNLLVIENKIHRYHALCKKYEKLAGTDKAAGILRQMDLLKDEIDKASVKLTKTLDETKKITHKFRD